MLFLVRCSLALKLSRISLDVGASAVKLGTLGLSPGCPAFLRPVMPAGRLLVTLCRTPMPLRSLASHPCQLGHISGLGAGDHRLLGQPTRQFLGAFQERIQVRLLLRGSFAEG